ncbi:MAG: hypothetical protein QOD26_3512 [Betaproteobacteria bacterium]|jgi:hypothetical protein|nr:hypothetical protein [Betaproteobacteria bacterium]
MPHANLSHAHSHFNALREIVIHRPGGWADTASLARAKELCRAADEAADDAKCTEHLASIAILVSDLYSHAAHRKWDRTQTSGRDVLRLHALRELNFFEARLLALEEMRRGHPADDSRLDRKP